MQNHYTININAEQVSVYFGADPNGTATEIDSMATAHIKQILRDQFTPRKRDNMHLADAYQLAGLDNGVDKAVRLATCARWLEFAVPPDGASDRYKIVKTSSCHVRLCPVCQWRRSVNTFRNLAMVYNDPSLSKYKHVFVTLTQRNVDPADLKTEIEKISEAYSKIMRRKPLKDLVKGYTRTIEITIREDGTYHPHIHAIWTVAKSYGHREYLRQADLCKIWAEALDLNYIPVCDMRMIKNLNGKSVAEVAKYSIKPSDYITDHIHGTAEIVKILDPALDGKRFVSYGGIVRDIKQKLFSKKNLEDLETDLISKEWEEWERLIYEWHFSKGMYEQVHSAEAGIRQPSAQP